jgi:hypothetical protein
MALLVMQDVSAGAAVTFAAASVGGDAFPTDNRALLIVRNSGASTRTVTLASQAVDLPPGTAAAPKVLSVLAGTTVAWGPIARRGWANVSGQVAMTYSSATDLTVAVLATY